MGTDNVIHCYPRNPILSHLPDPCTLDLLSILNSLKYYILLKQSRFNLCFGLIKAGKDIKYVGEGDSYIGSNSTKPEI